MEDKKKMSTGNGFEEYKRLILEKMDDNDKRLNSIEKDIRSILISLSTMDVRMNIKLSIFGILAVAIPSAVVIVMRLIWKV